MRPVADKFPISLKYGAPGNYIAKKHTGTDFACPVGTPVRAPHDGTVITSTYSESDYGNYVVIKGPFGRKAWLLAHLSERAVKVGQKVKAGQVIGKSGNTGNTTGPHVHVEQRHPPFGYWDFEPPTVWK